jgi:hypothetical protein
VIEALSRHRACTMWPCMHHICTMGASRHDTGDCVPLDEIESNTKVSTEDLAKQLQTFKTTANIAATGAH